LSLPTEYFTWGVLFHWIADWPLQNSWMAFNKVSLRHPAAWMHGGIHFVALSFVFPPWMALILAVLHMLIDTRVPLNWWRTTFKFTGEEPMALHVAIWMDQIAHIICIGAGALVMGVIQGNPLPLLNWLR
jgi:hypothetical protein